jgi:universal stress protein E
MKTPIREISEQPGGTLMVKHILVVADRLGEEQRIIARAVEWASRFRAKLTVVGFVYEHVGSLPVALSTRDRAGLQSTLVEKHRAAVRQGLAAATGAEALKVTVDVFWEKRVADRVSRIAVERGCDLVMKSVHRSETLTYTPTDWQLLRGCAVPVLLVADRRWSKSTHVLAAVDLGTSVRSKQALNYDVAEEAAAISTALGSQLHVGYAVPFSGVLRDLDVLSVSDMRREAQRRAEEFRGALARRGISVDGLHVVTGQPEKALVNLAAKKRVGVVVIGCVGRKRLAGRVIGNTAEQILRLLKADVLALKPGSRGSETSATKRRA